MDHPEISVDAAARLKNEKRLHILYIAYWGAMEPLGQALILPTVLRFATQGLRVTLVSFEKPHHLADREYSGKTAQQLKVAGIQWIPLRYHQRPTAPSTAWDIAQGFVRSILLALRARPDVVHGRTYVGGVIGHLVSGVLRCPFVFHNEGFWPDEQVDSSFWVAGCWPYRLTKAKENSLYRRADAVITLSQMARDLVLPFRAGKESRTTVVVPSCVDLERFAPLLQAPRSTCNLVYIGSLGGRYRIDGMARFFKAMRREIPSAMLNIYSQSDGDSIRFSMRECGIEDSWWSLDQVQHAAIPQALARQSAGLHFLTPGINSRVGSPTKIGEYWACGIPVVTTPHVGDVDVVVQRDRVGVIVEEDCDAACARAARELRVLLQDAELAQRCRFAAEREYSVETAVSTQVDLYERLTKRNLTER